MTKSDSQPSTGSPGSAASAWPKRLLHVLWGALIGAAETVPGVSAGTVALVVGVYDDLITSGGHLFSGVARLVTDLPRGRGRSRADAEFRQVHWRLLLPLLLGMLLALALLSGLMATWVDEYPVQMRALFFGLVLVSLWVPVSLAARTPSAGGRAPTRWGPRDVLIAFVAAVVSFALVSLPPGDLEPTPPVIMLVAVFAISGLVLPGLSGSFIMLAVGLYEPTMSAISSFDVRYLGLFAIGAIVGVVSIVKLLQWLLEHRKRVTLVVLTGLMAGGLRALWPWQSDDRALQAPDTHLIAAVGFGLLGCAIVAAALTIERKVTGRRTEVPT